MRLLTEILLKEKSEKLSQENWKPDEVHRCFKKADALLDYIANINSKEYVQKSYYKE